MPGYALPSKSDSMCFLRNTINVGYKLTARTHACDYFCLGYPYSWRHILILSYLTYEFASFVLQYGDSGARSGVVVEAVR
jgi:hypothetical protein